MTGPGRETRARSRSVDDRKDRSASSAPFRALSQDLGAERGGNTCSAADILRWHYADAIARGAPCAESMRRMLDVILNGRAARVRWWP
jgi:hypothetical protein